ncbi:Asp-tRNA(Asn)/Glu-tRNA(Gln) amidotransferase subunit GatC [Patescibacteria group bacterium]|nr:Asp-tRNA(Asn)/Glu-tRNA(Gln) amidotransferase subunit GatC [Patescibacteria group bacterium]MBU4162420.1 Asp-tRNA(Asn)/Glu-tRNA(Gln) amidotransferase subunit GatC [Patescibacteria group bacterium]
MIDLKQVKHIAELARISFTEKELKGFQKDISAILDYIDKLKEVDIEDVSAMSHSVNLKNITRIDEVKSSSDELVDELVNAAPYKKGRAIKVKPIF